MNNSSVKIEVELDKVIEESGAGGVGATGILRGGGREGLARADNRHMEAMPGSGNHLKEPTTIGRKRKTGSITVKEASTKRQKTLKKSSMMTVDLENEKEDFHPVTVEIRRACMKDKEKTLVTHVQVNLISHCVFCLRKTSKSLVKQEETITEDKVAPVAVVPRADLLYSSPKLLSAFNRIWEHFQKKKNRLGHYDPLGFLEPTNFKDNTDKCTRTFLELPTMCQVCAEKMEQVYKIMEELKTQLTVLGRIMKDSGKLSRRAEQFKCSLKNFNLNEDVITATMDLFSQLDFYEEDHVEEREAEEDPLSEPLKTPKKVSSSLPPENSRYPKRNLKRKTKELLESPLSLDSPLSHSEDESACENFDDDDFDLDKYLDPNYIKCEPEEDYYISEDDDSLADDNEKIRLLSSSPQRSKAKRPSTSISSPSTKKRKATESGSLARRKNKNSSSSSDKKEKPSSVKPQKKKNAASDSSNDDTDYECEAFTCEIDGCGESYLHQKSLRTHQVKVHGMSEIAKECSRCGKIFNSSKGLRYHVRSVHGEPGTKIPLQVCDLCKVQVPTTSILAHVRAHVGDDFLIKCPFAECPNVYSNSKFIYKHLKQGKTHPRSKSTVDVPQFLQTFTTCQVCDFKANSTTALRTHLLRVHETSEKNVSCPITSCPLKFTVKQSVALHIRQHDMQSAFDTQNCAECNVKLSLSEMEQHLRETHQAKPVIQCNRCPFLFSSRELLVNHLFVHRHGVLQCDICGDDGVKFLRHNQLCEHYFRVHQVGKKYACEQEHCSYSTLSQKSFLEHVKRHEGASDSLGEGAAAAAANQRKCNECDAVYASDFGLQDHKIREHGAKPYSCKYCSATLQTSYHLSKHEREHKVGAHTEEFRCDVPGCEKVYKSRADLKHHIARGHLGERPHICELCGKSYATPQGLRLHNKNVHLGLRPHVCDICGENFAVKRVMVRHKLIHTGERPFTCDICGQRFRTTEVLARHLEAHQRKGADFKPNGPMKHVRKRV